MVNSYKYWTKQECAKDRGWNILNKIKTGGLGKPIN